ncbi:MAG: hypothetical protein CO170_02555 [candidate division SR1 bacterium CG_4_9_14_3_um_filter_40_9]|nr:MAG: hypothetical protein CO170_02555 [candidate division SR1 bacterium CG_4_9_14_3_um_filter_40_9]
MTIELSQVLDGYEDIDWKLLEPMLREHEAKFDIYKLEKDFLLTIILIYLGKHHPELIFKGGTCLNKIYYDYYRLSEDLDFVVIGNLGKNPRRRLLEQYKQLFSSDMFKNIGLTLSGEQTKYNTYRQGRFKFLYNSFIDNSPQMIKIDIRFEPILLLAPISKNIRAIFKHPIFENIFFQNHTIQVMDLNEIFAEKTRAALTREYPAIRDFFDVWYARERGFEFESIRPLICQKIGDLAYTIDDAFDILQQQIKTELDPVLNSEQRGKFTLKEIYDFILTFKKDA